MSTSVNIHPELIQALIALNQDASIEAIVDRALRRYLAEQPPAPSVVPSFGESVLAFRHQHNVAQQNFDPDQIWGNVRDRSFTGNEVSFE